MKNLNNENFVTCNIVGPGEDNPGLGNQLFCIATVLAYSKKHNKIPVFPQIESNPKIKIYSKNLYKNLSKNMFNPSFLFNEKKFEYEEIPFIEGNLVLNGYFQSEKYFKENKKFILEMFNIEKIKTDLIKKYGDFRNSTSIHVRRGDYLKLNEYHENLNVDYYKQAISLFSKDEEFIIFSDDIEWCKNNFSFLKNVKYSNCIYDYEDLVLMSTCKNNIIANSTFSWWSAWFNDNKSKKIMYPEKWFGYKNNHLNIEDLIPKNWKSI